MANEESLNQKNAWLIRTAMITHIVAFSWVALEPARLISVDRNVLMAQLEAAAAPGTVSLGLIVLVSLVLLGLIPSKWQDRLIHWRWTASLPGSRAFTVIGPDSQRVDMTALEARYGPLPSDPGAQNRVFFKIYQEYQNKVGVLDAHRSYLATRNIGTINAILTVALPWFAWTITGDGYRAAIYAALLLLVYVLFAISAQNYGKRMVENVLAVASSQPVPPPTPAAEEP